MKQYGTDWSSPDISKRWISDYAWSVFARGDNTVEAAMSLGILDARELYPDVKIEPFEDFARNFYKSLA